MRGDGRIFLRGSLYWVAYFLRGKEFREAAKTKDGKPITDPNEARKFLKARLREVGADLLGARTFVTPQASRLTVHELLEALRADYKLRGILSTQSESHIDRVDADFGQARASDLTAEKIDEYISRRVDDGHAASSINRTTQLLGQAYKLAIRRSRLSRMPHIRHLRERGNARQGFFSEQEFQSVLANLPDDLKDFVLYAYVTGSRSGEIKSLTWKMVDADVLRIPGDITKNRKDRVIPLGDELAEIIKRRRAARQVEVNGTIQMVEHIFHRNGRPVGQFRKSWASACKKAGVTGKIFHDLRRSFARNAIQAGVPQQLARKLGGWESDSIFSRYAIVVEDDLRTAQERTKQYRETVQQKVVAIAQGG
jgi:integrase